MSDNRKMVSFRLSEEIIQLLKEISDKENRSQGNMIEELIKEKHKKMSKIKKPS